MFQWRTKGLHSENPVATVVETEVEIVAVIAEAVIVVVIVEAVIVAEIVADIAEAVNVAATEIVVEEDNYLLNLPELFPGYL
jgi:hypothetical protein